MGNNLKDKLKEDKLACKIQKLNGCTWEEAFERARIELFEDEIQLGDKK